MIARRPQPWHDKARAMKAEGATHLDIAIELDLSQAWVAALFSDTYYERQRASQAAAQRRRYREDPAFRAREVARIAAYRASRRAGVGSSS